MIRLIERCLDSLDSELVLLAPRQAGVPGVFENVAEDTDRHQHFLSEMQRLRGSIYVHEGNIKREQLTADGRHEMTEDSRCWHLLMADHGERVRSCAMYIDYGSNPSFDDLRARHCPLVKSPEWGGLLRRAVDLELARAERSGLRFAELGGWAIEKRRRGTPEGLMMALATYGLSRVVGGSLGMTTANVAHSCSAILRRLGGSFFEVDGTQIPTYFDHRYNTEIDLLRFDSRRPNPKFEALIENARRRLGNVLVVAHSAAEAAVDLYRPAQAIHATF